MHMSEITSIEWDGGTYTGQVKDGKPNGKGVLDMHEGYCYNRKSIGSFGKGSRYEGNFVDGRLEGKGICEWREGTRYEGDFVHGEIKGFGTLTFTDNRRYVGEMANGVRHGKGRFYSMENGREVLVYEGEYRNDNVYEEVSKDDLLAEILGSAEAWSFGSE